jgi:hypothetical protein
VKDVKAYWESGYIDPGFCDLGASHRCQLHDPAHTSFIGWMGLKADLEDVKKRKILDPNGTGTPTLRSSSS